MANIIRRQGRDPSVAWDPIRRMRDLFDWDPFAEMAPYRGNELDQFEARFEVKESKDAYVFKADLPGVQEKDLDISLTGNRLTVSGRRECEDRHEDDRYFAYECAYGSFTRSFTLPDGVDSEHAAADMKNGVLTITLPKKPETQPRKISLGGGEQQRKVKA